MTTTQPRRAWVTLLTRTSYLPGAVLLAHSLQKQTSAYPLVILYTSSLPASCLATLAREATLSNASLLAIEALHPREQGTLIAARFEDTWTKLRVFSLVAYERLVFLDADMLVLHNMDELFDIALPNDADGMGIAANHACVCNLDGDAWAPRDWMRENCAYTVVEEGPAATGPCTVSRQGEGKRTHRLLNSGLVVLAPSAQLWASMLAIFYSSPLLKDFLFPDQDFLATYFAGRWRSLGYQYNALKTMRYWHPRMWHNDEVKNVHYIVDKPWSKRVGPDGIAGYLGRDGETHAWWWEEFERWETLRERQCEKDVLALVRLHSGKPIEADEKPECLHGDWKAIPSGDLVHASDDMSKEGKTRIYVEEIETVPAS